MPSTADTPFDLTVPQALLTLVHTPAGQPYQRFRPAQLSAAAELAELAVRGDVEVAGDRVVAARASTDGPPWRDEVTAELARRTATAPMHLPTWLRQRHDAYDVQREEAVRAGLVEAGRSTWLGFIPYRTHVVDPGQRARVVDAVTDPRSATDPRVAAVAALVVGADVASVLDLTPDQLAGLRAVARAAQDPAVVGPLSAMTTALTTVAFVAVGG